MQDEDTRPPLPGAGTMENFTKPFLVTAAVLLFMFLVFVLAAWGWPGVMIASVLVDRIIPRR